MNHTPGPWTKQGGYLTIYTLTDCATNAIAHTLHHANSNGSTVTREQAEANANLIAAAPDLLAACKRIEAWFDGCIGRGELRPNVELDAIRAAIAKAWGAA